MNLIFYILLEEPDYAREIGLILYGILLTVVFIFGFDLMDRYVSADKITRKSDSYTVFYILAWTLMGYSGYNAIAIVHYFYTSQGYALMYFNRQIVAGLVRVLSLTLLLPISHISEEILWRNKYKIRVGSLKLGFTAIFGTLMILYQILWIYLGVTGKYIGPTSHAPLFFYPLVASYIIFGLTGFFGLMRIIFHRLKPQKNESRLVILGLSSGIIALIGAIIQGVYRADPSMQKVYLLGIIIEIAGWGFVRHFLLAVPSYSEFEWRSYMYSIYIVLPEGISLFHHVFKPITDEKGKEVDSSIPNHDLIACGIVGVKALLEEITNQEGTVLDVLQIGDRTIIGGQAPRVITFMIADKNLGVYHTLMRELAERINDENPQLEDFNGDLNTLKIKPIVEELFNISLSKPKNEKSTEKENEASEKENEEKSKCDDDKKDHE